MSHLRLGEAREELEKSAEALADFQHGLVVLQALADTDPNDVRARRDLSMAFQRVGDAHVGLGQKAEALANYQHSVDIEQTLARAEPDNLRAQRDLSISYMRLGEGQRQLGELTGALATYQKCLAIDEAQAQANPDNPQAQRDLGCTYGKFGILYAAMASDTGRSRADRMARWREAQEWLERSVKQFSAMRQRGMLGSSDQDLLNRLTAQIEVCEKSLRELTGAMQEEQDGPG
jgi:tetratricopeptide (TPR) repeat protein